MAKLDGKTALITGAAAGLGKGIAEVYAKYGAQLCLFDLDECVNDLKEELLKQYPDAAIITYVGNVAKFDDLKKAVSQSVEAFGGLDIICANAGVCRLAPFEEMSDEVRDLHIDVNIKGVWNTCKAVIPYMLKQGKGAIVIASSVTGDIVADAGEAAYAMTKAALVGLTKCLAVEYADRNIRVNCIMNLSGPMTSPNLSFDLELPTVNEEDQELVRSLTSTEDQMNTQIIYLLGIGKFYPYDNGAGNTQSSATSSLAFSTLSGQLNNMLSQVIDSQNWNIGTNLSTGQNESQRFKVLPRSLAHVDGQKRRRTKEHGGRMLSDYVHNHLRIKRIRMHRHAHMRKQRVPHRAHNAERMKQRQRAANVILRRCRQHHAQTLYH